MSTCQVPSGYKASCASQSGLPGLGGGGDRAERAGRGTQQQGPMRGEAAREEHLIPLEGPTGAPQGTGLRGWAWPLRKMAERG